MDFTIRTTGVDEVKKALKEAARTQAFKPSVEKGLNVVKDRLATYPEPARGQTYRRTGTLGRSWTGPDVDTDGLSGKIGTGLFYAKFVQGEDEQSEANRAWETVDEALQESESEIMEIVQRGLQELVDDFNRR